MNIYFLSAIVGLGLIVGAMGTILNLNQLLMVGIGLGLIIGSTFRYIEMINKKGNWVTVTFVFSDIEITEYIEN